MDQEIRNRFETCGRLGMAQDAIASALRAIERGDRMGLINHLRELQLQARTIRSMQGDGISAAD